MNAIQLSGTCRRSTPQVPDDGRESISDQDPSPRQNAQPTQRQPTKTTSINGYESIIRFLSLPSQTGIVLLLEFLNSFRSFGLRAVLYNYITNEYGISDTYAGELLGIKGFVDILFGLVGSILVDIVGVRKVSICALSVAIIGRTLLAFGKTTTSLYFALFLFSPCGEALLSVGLYRVALKKLTTPLTRPLAFAVSYAASNLAGALGDLVVDKMRSGLDDFEVDERLVGLGGVYTPVRQFVVLTWVVVLLTFIIAYFFLEDQTVIDENDLDENDLNHNSTTQSINASESDFNYDGGEENDDGSDTHSTIPHDAIPAKPMISPRLLKRWFPNRFPSVHSLEDEDNDQRDGESSNGTASSRLSSLPNYKVFKTRYANDNTTDDGSSAGINRYGKPCSGIIQMKNQLITILSIRNTWKVLIFGFASFTVAMQWTAFDIVLPPFLERRFGEFVPIYTIQSINLFGCLILPPIIGAFTTGKEDFQIILPGLWMMAVSPIMVAICPNVFGACMWLVFMTIGEVLWSPRQDSWTAGLAPTGMEGLFFAVGSTRAILGPLGDMAMGMMNEKYNSNCPECRDKYGHFCQNLSSENNVLQCFSVQDSCDLFLTDDSNQQPTCPKTCLECPTWEPTDPSAFWYLLILASIASPLAVWFFLPFLRGRHNRGDRCYGIFLSSKRRFLGICGARDDRETTYGHIEENEVFECEDQEIQSNPFSDEVEFI